MNRSLISITFASLVLLAACSEQSESEKDLKTQSVESTDSPVSATDSQTLAEQSTPAAPAEQSSQETSLSSTIDKSDSAWKQKLSQPEVMDFEPGKSYFWDLQTDKGLMSFRLFHESAPMHATSTIYLSKIGFYDEVKFHRVIPGFMAQGGDPTGTGSGGPGYNYAGEFDSQNSHDRPGLLSMANAGPNTDGSQFFITFVATPFLDGKHTIFGEMVAGNETLSSLEAIGSRSGRPSEPVQIIKATIRVE